MLGVCPGKVRPWGQDKRVASAGNTKATWDFLRGKGLTPAQAAGIIGSMQGESGAGLDPTATNPHGGAYGIAQWLGGRKAALLKQANPSSLKTQLNFLWSELQGPEAGALKGLMGAHTPESAAVAWQKLFERGAPFEQKYDQRAANARRTFNSLKGTQGGAGALMDASAQQQHGGPATSSMGPPAQQQGGGIEQALTMLLGQQQRPQIQSAGIQSPAFSARPSLPGGYAPPQGGGAPAPRGPDVSALLSLVAGAGQQQAPGSGGAAAADPTGQAPAPAGAPSGVTPLGGGTARDGVFKITGPNPGRIKPSVVKFADKVSAVYGQPLTGSDGTGHSYLTVNGNVSQHSTGNATDIPASGRELVRMGRAALIAAGMPRAQALKQTGGLFNVNGHQIIFNTHEGGDHTDHLHISARG